MYTKIPWEDFGVKRNMIGERIDPTLKFLPVECNQDDTTELIKNIRSWIKSGQAGKRFGEHIKYIEGLTTKTLPTQVDRTVRMNRHGMRFQASIDMTELQGLDNPNGKCYIQREEHKN